MAYKFQPNPTLKHYYCSLFSSEKTAGIREAQTWDESSTPIHCPLSNIIGTFVPINSNYGLMDLSDRNFTPTTKTRNSAKKNPKRHKTVWYEFGLAKNLAFRDGAEDLLQGCFYSAETYDRIHAIVQLESTKMIIIHAYKTPIVPGPQDPPILSNHTIIAACTYHTFKTTDKDDTNCFVSYLAVTNKQYTKDTVTGVADRDRHHKPFRDGGYGFSWLLIRMASLLSGTDLSSNGPRRVTFAKVYLQVQKSSHARSIFLRNGFVPASPLNSAQLSFLENLTPSKQLEINYQNSRVEDIESLNVYGKIPTCFNACLVHHSSLPGTYSTATSIFHQWGPVQYFFLERQT
jgi:hypothetical protein